MLVNLKSPSISKTVVERIANPIDINQEELAVEVLRSVKFIKLLGSKKASNQGETTEDSKPKQEILHQKN